MNEEILRTIIFYKSYFIDFFKKQQQKVKDKILWTFKIIETQNKIPASYLKHLEGTEGIYEIRVQYGNDIFRIFCFFDEGKIVVWANGIQNKTNKTPIREIEKAVKIKKEYELDNTISKI
jgi:phage-related protein